MKNILNIHLLHISTQKNSFTLHLYITHEIRMVVTEDVTFKFLIAPN